MYRLIPLTYSVCKLLTLQYTFKICYYILLSVKKNLLCFKDLYYIHSTCVLSEEESVVSLSDQKRQVRCWYCHGKMFFSISCVISSYLIYIFAVFSAVISMLNKYLFPTDGFPKSGSKCDRV